MKQTLLATLYKNKHIKSDTKIEADYIGVNEDGTLQPKKRAIFNVKSVKPMALHPALELEVVNVEDGTETVIFSYDIKTIDGKQPQRFAVAKGIPADGIERLKKRRGRKPKIRDQQDQTVNE
jgi:hypothetical protein